jgi:hypothetical protein
MNIYDLVSQELTRMHDLLKTCVQTSAKTDPRSMYSTSYGNELTDTVVWQRIIAMQDILMKALSERDVIIQEKIAELALTGKDETNGK